MENFRTEPVNRFSLRANRCAPRNAAVQAQDPEADLQISSACVCRNSHPVSALDQSLSRRNSILGSNQLQERSKRVQERIKQAFEKKKSKP